MRRRIRYLLPPVALLVGLLWILGRPVGGSFTPGPLLEPVRGLYATARHATPHESDVLLLEGMTSPVVVDMDARGVPHITAGSDRDAVMAMGYVVARDRLFEMEFLWRVATGRLSEVLGRDALAQDQYFRRIGMARAVHDQALRTERLTSDAGRAMGWYAEGANAWISSLTRDEYPFEYRLLGFAPAPFTAEHTAALQLFMTFDLSYSSGDVAYEQARRLLSAEDYAALFPEASGHEEPIVPASAGAASGGQATSVSGALPTHQTSRSWRPGGEAAPAIGLQSLARGYIEGTGSNNWAVSGEGSASGKPILAGDMHLNLSLPAIWYEIGLYTPTARSYGVTFPSVPVIVEGITDRHAWTFTNTGADQIDRYLLTLDASGGQYLHDGAYRPLTLIPDTIRVRGGEPVVSTLTYSHHGPVEDTPFGPVAVRWVGHEPNRTLEALWGMHRARSHAEFEEATRQWDSPMQNILYADADGTISIRATGYWPRRQSGEGLLDGSTSDAEWQGRVPFDELPAWTNPGRGFLTSTNQRPAAAAGPYMGRDWRSVFRSRRIHTLLSGKKGHDAEDLKAYQADVHAVQADYLIPLVDTLSGLDPAGQELVRRLQGWDRRMTTTSRAATLFAALADTLYDLVWDEPVFMDIPRPHFVRMFAEPGEEAPAADPVWFDMVSTPDRETFADVLREAIRRQGPPDDVTPWGDVHTLQMRHITRSPALRAVWRENMSYPGWKETLSPARGMQATHSASWRVVVDFSDGPPRAWGVYPGGQSGNPFSRHYDAHVETFVSFDYYALDLTRITAANDTGEQDAQ